MELFAAVLAGGSGTRFWPASTARVPKQFLPLTGDGPMLRVSVDRLLPIVPPERIAVVTSSATRQDVLRVLPDLPPENVLGEPRGRNTAAACALAARWAERRSKDAVLLTTPSDHLAEPTDELRAMLRAAAERAARGPRLMTLGLRPTFAATGYGWIRLGEQVGTSEGHAVHRVERFVEKPDRARAEQFLADGAHLWNLGLFAWRPEVFLAALERHLPETARAIVAATDGAPSAEAVEAAYATIPSISVDHAVLEKHDVVECLPCSFRWDDLGSFAAAARHLPHDADGNAAVGALLALESAGCMAWSDTGGLTALLGVRDLVVVHAHGVTLVAPKARAEEVRRLVEALGPAGLERFR